MASVTYQYHPLWNVLQNGRPYEPFPWQAQHVHAQAAVKTRSIVIGRRGGKSSAAKAEVVSHAFMPSEVRFGVEQHPLVYVIAPNYELTMKIWQPIWDLFVGDENASSGAPLASFKRDHDKNRKIIWLKNGAVIQAKSADDPKSLQGDGVTFAVVDEAQDLNEEAWANFVPSMLETKGKLLCIGIARGKGRFRSYYERGLRGEPGFYSGSAPSTAHPGITLDMLEDERSRLSDIEFRQQYLAEWVEQDGAVFRDVASLFTAPGLDEPEIFIRGDAELTRPYIASLDVAKTHDYTVCYIVDPETETFVAKDRFNGLDYPSLVERVASLIVKFRCLALIMDATGVGEPVADMLRQHFAERGIGCSIVGFKFTNESKANLVSTMVREVERKQVTFLRSDADLKREMDLFEATVGTGGLVRYSAPPGYFDDCVMAAGLAIVKSAKSRNISRDIEREPYIRLFANPDSRRRRERVLA